jgi:hypothetical protein
VAFLIISSTPKIPVSASNSTIGDATGSENILLQEKSHSDPLSIAVKWKYNASGSILFSPIVGEDGTIYIISKPFYTLHAINPDGTLKWKYDVEYEVTDYREKNGTIYLCVTDPQWVSYLVAIDSKGNVKWRYKLSSGLGEEYIISTINDKGVIYVTKRAFIDEIYAMNPDGTVRWKIHMSINHLLSSVYIDGSGTVYVNTGESNVYIYGPDGELKLARHAFHVLDPDEGRLKMSYKYPENLFIHSFRRVSDKIYLLMKTFGGRMYLYLLGLDGMEKWKYEGDEYWDTDHFKCWSLVDEVAVLIFGTLDFFKIYAVGSDGVLKWKTRIEAERLGGVLLDKVITVGRLDSTAYFLGIHGQDWVYYASTVLFAMDMNEGTLKWSYIFTGGVEARRRMSLNQDGTIYLLQEGVNFVILSPKGEVITKINLHSIVKDRTVYFSLGGTCILGGTIFILADKYLIAISSLPLKKTMLTMNINPSKIVEKVRKTITITGRLTNETGNGLSERAINIYKDGNVIGSCTTDSNGYYEYKWKNAYLEKGSYTITAKFGGDPDYAASNVSTSLIVTENQLPIASFVYSPENSKAGEETKLDASTSRDPDGEIRFYEWDLNGDGEYDGYTTSPVIYYFWDKSGTYLVKLKVIDNSGDSSEFVKEVNIKPNSLWEKIKKFFSSSVIRLSESERKRFEIIKSRLGIHNHPHSNNPSSDPDFYWVSDDQLLTILKKKVDPAASDLTYEALITDTLYDMELVDSIAGRSWSVDPKITEYFESMSEVNAWAKVGLMVSKETLSGIIKEIGGSDIGLGPILMLPDLCKALGGLKLLEEEFYRRALWHYFELRDSGYSPDEAFKSSPIPPKYQNDATKKYFEELWIEYGNHISDRGGLEQEFKRQVISQLRRILLSALEIYKFEPYQIYILKSSCEICVFDSQKRVTGMVNGKYREEIPNSAYDDESKTIVIFNATDSYNLQVKGIKEGNYSLLINSIINRKSTVFTANDIPIKPKEIHEYSFDWRTLSQGGKGATVQVDFDGDGKFEKTFTTSTELSRSEFLQSTSEIPPSLNLIAILIAIIVIVAIVFLYLRKRGKL